jgi:hypothetical protein
MSRARNLSDVGGISYITATGNKVGIGSTIPQYTLDVNGDVSFSGTLYQGGSAFSSGVGIQSAGTVIGTGITTLNFIGLGNTFAVNGNTVNISITGGGSASYASTAGIATYATTAGIATYATSAGIATYATSAGIATNSTTAGYATTAGIATVAQGLTGTPNITVGVITAVSASFSGNVSIAGTLTYEDVTNVDSIGLVTARSGVQVTGGNLLVGSTSATGTASQPLQVTGGAYVSGNVGLGTTNPTQKLDVSGTILVSDGVYMMDANINANVTVPAGKNALMIGPITVGTGYTVTVQSGSTLVVV